MENSSLGLYCHKWSSGQNFWLQIQRSVFDSRRYQIFWEVLGLERCLFSLPYTLRIGLTGSERRFGTVKHFFLFLGIEPRYLGTPARTPRYTDWQVEAVDYAIIKIRLCGSGMHITTRNCYCAVYNLGTATHKLRSVQYSSSRMVLTTVRSSLRCVQSWYSNTQAPFSAVQ
jgi:hypothetical protein